MKRKAEFNGSSQRNTAGACAYLRDDLGSSDFSFEDLTEQRDKVDLNMLEVHKTVSEDR